MLITVIINLITANTAYFSRKSISVELKQIQLLQLEIIVSALFSYFCLSWQNDCINKKYLIFLNEPRLYGYQSY